jgi:hypothetical protein
MLHEIFVLQHIINFQNGMLVLSVKCLIPTIVNTSVSLYFKYFTDI